MSDEPLATAVDVDQVAALLLARAPEILDADSPQREQFDTQVALIASEVIAVTGPTPTGEYRDLAVTAITVGVAAQLESALFPEQQFGDGSRAAVLQARYERLLTRLGAAPDAAGELPAVLRPVGSFPSARAYPDPAERC